MLWGEILPTLPASPLTPEQGEGQPTERKR